MRSIRFDSPTTDQQRRDGLYNGDLFVYSPTPAGADMCELARNMLIEAFDPLEPETAQHHMSVEAYAAILAELKPQFIHHPSCKTLLPKILEEHGCDPEQTYFDVPRLRSSTANDYLTTGIAFAFHPHRDTWYSASFCQLNWWMPVFEMDSNMGMAFHPRYFDNPLANNSDVYDYYRWNAESRGSAAKHIGTDTRQQPTPQAEVDRSGDIEIVTPVGGLTVFSGAQLHSSIANQSNRTRFSIDFRTVNLNDVVNHIGAANVDSRCTGTSLRDFLRCTDLSLLPDELCREYDTVPPPQDAILTYNR